MDFSSIILRSNTTDAAKFALLYAVQYFHIPKCHTVYLDDKDNVYISEACNRVCPFGDIR
ncbi:hypothetical protein TanjilG_15191 [Lupinus angustifolius]|uniref:Uncharacterized protein n=1 Tax=Lupinus angustifolius TaxID=3871 RepID=A0A1J7H635_LUPAN|nr:hypothetical protein TanjilG_15191 [Lupinus angustifolius]